MDFASMFQDPRMFAGMSLLTNPGGGGMQDAMQAMMQMQRMKQSDKRAEEEKLQNAAMMEYRNRQLKQQEEQYNRTNALKSDDDIRQAEQNKGLNDYRQAQIAHMQGQTSREERAAALEEEYQSGLPERLQAALGGQAPTGATQQFMGGAGGQSPPMQSPQAPMQPQGPMPMPAVQGGPGMGGPQMAPGQTPGGVPQPPPRVPYGGTMVNRPPPQLGAPGAVNPRGFLAADSFVEKAEGGFTTDTGGDTFAGISQKAHPEVNVRELAKNKDYAGAQAIRKQYWDAIGGDNLDPKTAMVAYDSAINQGQGYARKLLQDTGGNPALMLAKRQHDYAELAKQDKYKPYEKGWANRIDHLKAQLNQADETPPQAAAEQPAKPSMSSNQREQISEGFRLMGNPKTRLQGEELVRKAKEGRWVPPGQVNLDTGEAAPNPELDYRRGHDAARDAAHDAQKDREFGHTVERDTVGDARAAEEGKRKDQELELHRQRAKAEEIRAKAVEGREARQQTDDDRKRAGQVAKDEAAYGAVNAAGDRAVASVNKLLSSKGLDKITGLASTTNFAAIPGGDAKEALNELHGLKSKLVHDILQATRAASQNGASGYGSFTEKELDVVQGYVANLDPSGNPKDFRNKLGQIRTYMQDIQNRSASMYEQSTGKSAVEGLPQGSRKIGTSGGKAVYRLPDGSQVTGK